MFGLPAATGSPGHPNSAAPRVSPWCSMPGKDLQALAHCVYMFDLLLRELNQSSALADKDYATATLIETFARVLRREGYAMTAAKLRDLLAYAG